MKSNDQVPIAIFHDTAPWLVPVGWRIGGWTVLDDAFMVPCERSGHRLASALLSLPRF